MSTLASPAQSTRRAATDPAVAFPVGEFCAGMARGGRGRRLKSFGPAGVEFRGEAPAPRSSRFEAGDLHVVGIFDGELQRELAFLGGLEFQRPFWGALVGGVPRTEDGKSA